MPKKKSRYPKIRIGSKNELAKRISEKSKIPLEDIKKLIKDVTHNHLFYWHDLDRLSEAEKGKFFRNCAGTPLGRLLKLIDQNILATADNLIPEFIFGGVKGKNHVKAALNLLGKKRKRIKLGLDLSKFFELNRIDRVVYLLHKKFKCSLKASKTMADLFCVPKGPKGSGETQKVLARGFATSSRLAIWCNLDIFLRIYWETKKFLKRKDYRISVYVDDIGITASQVSEETIDKLFDRLKNILENHDPNQRLELNTEKKNTGSYKKNDMEYLGLKLGKKISLGNKQKHKICQIKKQLKEKDLSSQQRKELIRKNRAHKNYRSYIKSQNTK